MPPSIQEPAALAWLAAGLYLVPALLWGILCDRAWWILRTRRPGSRLYVLLPVVTGSLGLHYFLAALTALYPATIDAPPPWSLCLLGIGRDVSLVLAVVSGRHVLRYFPDDEDPPTRRWLAWTYGPAAALALGAIFFAQTSWVAYQITYELFLLGNLALAVAYAARTARSGKWGHAGLTAIRTADVALFTVGLFLGALLVHGNSIGEACPWKQSTWVVVGNVVIGVVMALPFAMRMLGEVLRSFLLNGPLVVATFALYLGGQRVLETASPAMQRVGTACLLFALLLLLGPGRRVLRDAIGRFGFRRSTLRQQRLHEVLHTLAPDLGANECMRRALAEFVQVMRARGAALLLSPEGTAVTYGDLSFTELRNVWPWAAPPDELFRSGFGLIEMRELPAELREPLAKASIVGVFPIVSPRRRFGHLFMSSGLLGTVVDDEDATVIHGFTDQLALVLDATELLERAVEVERSLAHAEKLSAIGELAARIAHEIRNPVTAARSLAQSLCRDPHSPDNPEHAEIILAELERVEKQIAALLRFARRDELRPEPVDVGALARETADQFRLRLESAGIALDVEAPPGIVADVDREKIRQVLINLLENSIDAVSDEPGHRAIAIRVERENRHVEVAVSDNGPGVPTDALERIFEPFYSRKSQGTGLGLAIVKRTIEAHGGRVSATPNATAGVSMRVDLPLGTSAGATHP